MTIPPPSPSVGQIDRSAARPAARLRRELGLAAVAAVVVGDMLGSGIFFTPGELAAVAHAPWQVYLLWALCGGITLCGALTLAELGSRLPRAGAPYHIIREGFGPFWAFLKIWVHVWVSGPGSIAGVAIVFGEFVTRVARGPGAAWPAPAWGAAAIAFFVGINLLGIRWGGRTQVVLTTAKIAGLLGLVGGSLLFAQAVSPAAAADAVTVDRAAGGLLGFVSVVGLGVAAVLFTYDGWIDVSYVAGEVKTPHRNLPRGLGFGVAGITALYLLVNYAYLRVVPLEAMRDAPTAVATNVAHAAFGPVGGSLLNVLITVSIFGALGGLIMTLPRLYYAGAAEYESATAGTAVGPFFRGLAVVSARTAVPVGSLIFSGAVATAALLFFQTFSRIVNFFVVPLHATNVLMVAAIFRLRPRAPAETGGFRTPGYPIVPLVYIAVIAFFLVSVMIYRPLDTVIGIALSATSVPAYLWIARQRR